MLYGSTLTRIVPYFPDLFMPIVVGGFGIGMIAVILPLCAVAEVGPREIGPVSSITLMVYNLGGPSCWSSSRPCRPRAPCTSAGPRGRSRI